MHNSESPPQYNKIPITINILILFQDNVPSRSVLISVHCFSYGKNKIAFYQRRKAKGKELIHDSINCTIAKSQQPEHAIQINHGAAAPASSDSLLLTGYLSAG
ncbi:hypothetical protein XENTR_v10013372 [Xenopus tropicalis]|nr:hypothetical protein XENTR_v10013372 [Xenopus tropicalis]